MSSSEPSDAGRLINDHYDVMEHRLGAGHFSEVRLAFKRDGRQRVAVKVVRKQDAARIVRVQSEVAILRQCARLQHPNLLRLHDVFESDAEFHLVLEYLPGGSLLEVLKRQARQHPNRRDSLNHGETADILILDITPQT